MKGKISLNDENQAKSLQKDKLDADSIQWEILDPDLGDSRRSFIKKGALTAFATLLGSKMVFGEWFPEGLEPIGLLNKEQEFVIPEKSKELRILNQRPLNVEVPAHLLNDFSTPNELIFVRNNGLAPIKPNPDNWELEISGESAQKKLVLSLQELKSKFKSYSYHLTLECGGNGRSEFNPPAAGNQWSTGAVACSKWTGVRLRDVLNYVGLKTDAVYVAYYGADTHLSGDRSKEVISRGVPISKAMEDESLIAWAVNDKDIPLVNGYPLRLVFGGWPASCSGKWLRKIVIRNKVHDGAKMMGKSYRIPCEPVEPGAKVKDEDMCIIESMPVKSLITYPKSGAILTKQNKLKVKGKAWAGDHYVTKMELSINFGKTWMEATLEKPINRTAWQEWETKLSFPQNGYYEVWAKATDSEGNSQPMLVPGWNPKGYLNNAAHRIAIKVEMPDGK